MRWCKTAAARHLAPLDAPKPRELRAACIPTGPYGFALEASGRYPAGGLNESFSAEATAESQLCRACGMCCNGVIFANLALQPDDDVTRLRSLGVPVSAPRSVSHPPHLAQPCAAFEGCSCRIYADRPHYCRQFECVLLQSVKAGRMESAAALRIIHTGHQRADRVRRLLRALGDTDEQLPLSARFRRTGKRLKAGDFDEATADNYAQLTLAVHDLNLLLGDAFYPGPARRDLKRGASRAAVAVVSAALTLFATAGWVQADQLEMQNGDRYVGHVLSVNSNTVVLESGVLGTLRLPRNKVAAITLDPGSATRSPAPSAATNAVAAAPAKPAADLSPALRQLGAHTNLIQQVQKQFLAGAGDGANAKFNELLDGLMSGKLSVADIRAQASTAADQLRALKRDGGDDAGFGIDSYLAILDRFLKETAPAGSTNNAPGPAATR